MKVKIVNKVRDRYRRAGMALTYGAHVYEVTDEQLIALKNDPRLIVTNEIGNESNQEDTKKTSKKKAQA